MAEAMRGFDRLYPQPGGESALQQLLAQLAALRPYDLEETRRSEYKQLTPRWHDWKVVRTACARCAVVLFDGLAATANLPASRPRARGRSARE